jgi:nucleotide-binding universal stress UspA family protein
MDRVARVIRAEMPDAALDSVAGKPWRCIADGARDRGADLIVVGARGWSEHEEATLGTTTERVAQAAPVSVLVTRGAPPPAPRRIVIASDLSSSAELVAREALRMAAPAPASTPVVIVHAIQRVAGVAVPSRRSDLGPARDPSRRAEALARSLRDVAPDITVRIAADSPVAMLEAACVHGGEDLVAVGALVDDPLMLGGTTARVLRHTAGTVLLCRPRPAGHRP